MRHNTLIMCWLNFDEIRNEPVYEFKRSTSALLIPILSVMSAKHMALRFLSACTIALIISCQNSAVDKSVDVLVIGDGTGATAAAIQSAREGASTLLVTGLPWLGGMLTSAGVPATDGNHHMPAGLWGEFREALRTHYGGADKLATGWVSHTLFEPKIGASIFRAIAEREENLEIWFDANWGEIAPSSDGWGAEISLHNSTQSVRASILVDGTDLGDVLVQVGAKYDLGMDAASVTGEEIAPAKANKVIQDFTYAAILKDYGPENNHLLPRPEQYDPNQFYCSCDSICNDPEASPHPCKTMLSYAQLPEDKYMINWPLKGNDYYAPLVEMNAAEREEVYAFAKDKTLQFVYYIQNDLGFANLGLADDEFPTADLLPLMPYHREGRRVRGLVRMNLQHVTHPFEQQFYRTGIAVGDYPIDHHHKEKTDVHAFDFPAVPSFNIPLGCLIPTEVENLVIADKAISVTNIVNGSTRLQPVVLQIGQAAGIIAACAAISGTPLQEISVRDVQKRVLQAGGYLMPYYDVPPEHPHFYAIQRIGACGIMRGTGEPYKWANRTWFYPDSNLIYSHFRENIRPYFKIPETHESEIIPIAFFSDHFMIKMDSSSWNQLGLENFDQDRPIQRGEAAVLIDFGLKPFDAPISIQGKLMHE